MKDIRLHAQNAGRGVEMGDGIRRFAYWRRLAVSIVGKDFLDICIDVPHSESGVRETACH